MNYKILPIDKIKPDPNQPRKYFSETALKSMAISIKNEGIINAIEIDEKFIIITGEQRWKSAKIAGLKEVPVKIIEKITNRERFIRQLQENLNHNTMAALDTAMAFDKVRDWLVAKPTVGLARDKFHQGERYQRGAKELSKIFGPDEETISQYLDLLGTTGKLREALKDPKFARTKVPAIKQAPEKYQKKLEELVSTQKDISRDAVLSVVEGLKRAERYDEGHLAEKLLKENFSGLSAVETVRRINKIIPDDDSRLDEPEKALKFISGKYIEIMELLDNHPLESFDHFHRPLMVRDTNVLGLFLSNYLKGKKIEEKKKLLLN